MATTNTSEIIWKGYKTYLTITVTDPNPAGAVQVTWALHGENTVDPTGLGAPQTNICSFIKGYASSGNYSDEKGPGVEVNEYSPNYEFPIGQEWDSGYNTTVYYSACCRIARIEDGPDDLKVTLRNYITEDIHLPFSSQLHYSDTKVITVWVKKVPAGASGGS